MPFLIPVIAAVVAAVGTVTAVVAGALGAVAAAIGGVGFGLSVYGAALAVIPSLLTYALVSGVASLLSPSHPGSRTNAVAFKADTTAGLPYVIGRTGVGGNIVFVDTSNDGHNKWLHYITALSIGPVTSIDNFTANNVSVTFDPVSGQATKLGYYWRGVYSAGTQYQVNDGVSYSGSIYICTFPAFNNAPTDTNYWAPAGTYAGPAWLSNMWQLRTIGAQPDVVLLPPSGTGNVPEWSSINRLSGIAHTRWVLQADAKAYPGGTPAPIWTVRGMAVYDPRLDSTYPGGSGSQRAADYTTWAFSENPYLNALTWLLGQTNNGARTMGLGAPIAAIDVAAFVTGANVADANGWKVGGQVFSTDSKWDVLVIILQAGGGAPMRIGALISCLSQTPRVSIATLTGADFAGPVSVQAVVARKDRINRVIPSYRSERHQWAMVQADPITVTSYYAIDGGQRTKGITMPLVQQVKQAGTLARYAIEDSREFGPITGPLKPQWLGLQPGDCVTINEPEYGLNGQAILITDRKIDPSTASPTITARTETNGKHAFALGQVANPPPAPSLTGRNLVAAAPLSPPWMAVGGTVTSGGVAVPAIIVTGAMENPTASNLIIRTRLSAGPGPWEHYDSPPAAVASRVAITGVGSAETRDIELSYLVRGIQGLPLVLSSIVAGTFAGSGASSSVVLSAVVWTNISVSNGNPTSGSTNTVTFGGVTSAVTLTVTFTGSATLTYSKNGAAGVAILSGGTIIVASGDTLSFTASATTVGANTGTITLVNTSNAGAAVGAPTYSLTVANTLGDGTVLFTQNTAGAYSYTVVATAAGFVTVELWGGGGGGGRDPLLNNDGGGGGGGGYVNKHFAVTPGVTVIAGTVGPGGAGASLSLGTVGTASTVTSPAMTAGGGGRGSAAVQGTGGTATGGDINTIGRNGGLTNDWDGGGAGNGSGDQTHISATGTAPGGGGSGSINSGVGGTGSNGRVIITGHTT